jgi:hypothetical protein
VSVFSNNLSLMLLRPNACSLLKMSLNCQLLPVLAESSDTPALQQEPRQEIDGTSAGNQASAVKQNNFLMTDAGTSAPHPNTLAPLTRGVDPQRRGIDSGNGMPPQIRFQLQLYGDPLLLQDSSLIRSANTDDADEPEVPHDDQTHRSSREGSDHASSPSPSPSSCPQLQPLLCRTFVYHPLLPISGFALHRFVRSRPYRYLFNLCAVACIVIFAVPDFHPTSLWSFIVSLLIFTSFGICEFGRLDRDLSKMLLTTFDFWFLFAYLVVFVTFQLYAALYFPGTFLHEFNSCIVMASYVVIARSC